MTKNVLTREGVDFDVIDVEADPKALEYVRSLGYSAAPVVVADGEHWSGFKPERIRAVCRAR